MKNKNIMGAFAYFKNYFDRLSALLAFESGYENKGRNPNFKMFYKEIELIKMYAEIEGGKTVIEEAHKYRNENPLSHASAGLIDIDSSTNSLLKSIDSLYELAISYCRTIPVSTETR